MLYRPARLTTITVDVQETKVGIAVNKLRTHSDKTVAELAKDIVTRWKSEVKGPAGAKAKSESAAAPQKKHVSPGVTAKSPTTAVPEFRKSLSAQGGTGGRSKETDKVQWKCIGDGVRDNCLGMIYDGLCFEAAPEIGEYLQIIYGLGVRFM